MKVQFPLSSTFIFELLIFFSNFFAILKMIFASQKRLRKTALASANFVFRGLIVIRDSIYPIEMNFIEEFRMLRTFKFFKSNYILFDTFVHLNIHAHS